MHVFVNWVFIYIFIFSKNWVFRMTNVKKDEIYNTSEIVTPNELEKKRDL